MASFHVESTTIPRSEEPDVNGQAHSIFRGHVTANQARGPGSSGGGSLDDRHYAVYQNYTSDFNNSSSVGKKVFSGYTDNAYRGQASSEFSAMT